MYNCDDKYWNENLNADRQTNKTLKKKELKPKLNSVKSATVTTETKCS